MYSELNLYTGGSNAIFVSESKSALVSVCTHTGCVMVSFQTQFPTWLLKMAALEIRSTLKILLMPFQQFISSLRLSTEIFSRQVPGSDENIRQLHTSTPVCKFEGFTEKKERKTAEKSPFLVWRLNKLT